MKAVLRGLHMAGEMEIDRVTPTIAFPLRKVFSFNMEEDLSKPANIKLEFKFIRQIDQDLVIYELDGWS